MTTRQSASLVLQDEVKRGSSYPEPKAPLISGGEASTARSGFSTLWVACIHVTDNFFIARQVNSVACKQIFQDAEMIFHIFIRKIGDNP